LAGIARAGERFGRRRIVEMLLGDTGDLPPALTGLSTCGLLKHETSEALHAWIDAYVRGAARVDRRVRRGGIDRRVEGSVPHAEPHSGGSRRDARSAARTAGRASGAAAKPRVARGLARGRVRAAPAAP